VLGQGSGLERARIDDGGGDGAEGGDAAGDLLQVAHGAGEDLEAEAVLAGDVVGLGDLGVVSTTLWNGLSNKPGRKGGFLGRCGWKAPTSTRPSRW